MIASGYEFPAVKADFAFFEDFRQGYKIAQRETVLLRRPSEKVEYTGAVELETELSNGCIFEAIQSPKKTLKYALKIFAEDFGPGPCIRFCSRGPDHVNPERGGGLTRRNIPTPHFHKVESDGILYAYQTLPLLDPVESARISSDLQLGVNHFCQEMSLSAPSGGFVAVKIMPGELDLSTDDPLSGATFPL